MADDAASLRVHFVVHHARDVAAGASGATLALGAALERRGCNVSYYFFDDAFTTLGGNEISQMLRFPWKVGRHLARSAAAFDVVDVTTGDAWVWSRLGRRHSSRTALVTRSHGLEHVTADDLRRRARAGEIHLSRKYPVYHGGYRLWEVRQSLVHSDAQIFLNEPDREYAVRHLGVQAETTAVIPNGVRELLLDVTPVRVMAMRGPIALAFIGSWIPRKGIRAIGEMATILLARGVPFTLRLLGTGVSRETLATQFPAPLMDALIVTPRYDPAELPTLLNDAEVLIHPSWTEGFSLALVEGMACGLAPIATRSGGATTIVRDGETGVLLTGETGASLAEAVIRLAGNRDELGRIRARAQSSMQVLRWDTIAERTVVTYRTAIARRLTQIGAAA